MSGWSGQSLSDPLEPMEALYMQESVFGIEPLIIIYWWLMEAMDTFVFPWLVKC